MSTKKAQKINPLAKPNGSQTSTPNNNGGNVDDNNNHLPNQQQMNPQQQHHPQINPSAAMGNVNGGMPPGGMMGNNNMPMNAMNFGMNNPNFRAMPNANIHPQQMAALQASLRKYARP